MKFIGGLIIIGGLMLVLAAGCVFDDVLPRCRRLTRWCERILDIDLGGKDE